MKDDVLEGYKTIIKMQKEEIFELKKNSISTIQSISGSIVSNIIENISGDKLNESSIKAVVEDVSKKNISQKLYSYKNRLATRDRVRIFNVLKG